MSLAKSFGVFVFLLVLCVLAYWDIATFQDSLKWDMLDCYFPWRYFVGESVQHQVFPLWNSYQHLGYPIHADMRSVFYPEGFIVGLFGGYNLRVLHFLFIFYITIAGTGLYRLAGLFVKNEYVKITVGSAYLLCGFFVGHGQEMFGIIAACWIPWILHYFIRFQKTLQWSDLLKLAFFLFVQITGGYQALSIMLFYLLLIIAVVMLRKNHKENGAKSLFHSFRMNTALTAIVFSSLLVLLIIYLQVSPNVERLTGLTLHHAYLNSVTWSSFLSVILPYSVIADLDIIQIDISMANMYVGIIILIFYLIGTFQRKSALMQIFWIFGLICLLASMGPETPVREFLYNYIPGMNLFRMASFFSYFSQLSFLLLAAVAMDRFLKNPRRGMRPIAIGVALIILMVIIIMIYGFDNFLGGEVTAQKFLLNPFSDKWEMDYYQRLLYQGVVQLVVLISFLIVVFLLRKRRTALSFFIIIAVILEMSFALRLNFKATVGGGHDPSVMQAKLDAQPSGFPIPDLNAPLIFNREAKQELSPLWHNTNIYSKTVSWDGFNSFRLDRFEDYEKQQGDAYEQGLKQSLLYSTSEKATIAIENFAPDKIESTVVTAEKCTLILQQIYYPNWQITLNGQVQELLLYNNVFPSVVVPKGKNVVIFEYHNTPVLIGFYVSYLVFVLIIFGVLFHLFQSNGVSKKRAVVTSFILVGAMLVFVGSKWFLLKPMNEKRQDAYAQLRQMLAQELTSDVSLYLNVDNLRLMNDLLEKNGSKSALPARNLKDNRQAVFYNLIQQDAANIAIYAGSNLPENRVVMEIIRQKFPYKISKRIDREYVHIFSKEGERKAIYSSKNNLETTNAAWHYQENQRDSSALSFSGLFRWAISGSQMGSPSVILRVGDITNLKRLKLVFQAKCLVPSNRSSKANMYVQIERKNQPPWFRAKNINRSAINNADWFTATHVVEPNFDLQPDDVLKIFVWGGEGEPLYLDDLSFWVYAQAE